MKKLFLLLAGLAVMVSCNNTKPDPDPEPPIPGGDPALSKTELTMRFNEVQPLTVLNYNGNVTWATTDDFSAVYIDGKVYGLAIGTADIVATLANGKELKCSVTIEKRYEESPFKVPLLDWYATAADIKAKETRQFDSSEELKNKAGEVIGSKEIYLEKGLDPDYPNQYEYIVLTVPTEEGETGMVSAAVYMPTKAGKTQEETEEKVRKTWEAFSERYYFVGTTGPNEDQIYMNKEKTYSFLANTYYFAQDKSIIGWGCEHVNITDWVPSSTEGNVFQMPAIYNFQRSKELIPVVNLSKLLHASYLK